MTEKNIRRLFPCDDSMVVVIDDRADVWTWSPNLIKVHPCKYLKRIKSIKRDPFNLNYDTNIFKKIFLSLQMISLLELVILTIHIYQRLVI